jgi:chromosome segregation ATPase
MEPNFRSPIIAAALSVKADIITHRLVLAGEFATEIARLEELNATAAERMGIVKVLDEAEQVRQAAALEAADVKDAANALAAAAKVEAARLRDEAKAAVEAAQRRMNAVTSSEAAVSASVSSLAARVAEHDARVEALKKATEKAAGEAAAASKRMDEREAACVMQEAKHAEKAAALAAREKVFNAKLDALKMTA